MFPPNAVRTAVVPAYLSMFALHSAAGRGTRFRIVNGAHLGDVTTPVTTAVTTLLGQAFRLCIHIVIFLFFFSLEGEVVFSPLYPYKDRKYSSNYS